LRNFRQFFASSLNYFPVPQKYVKKSNILTSILIFPEFRDYNVLRKKCCDFFGKIRSLGLKLSRNFRVKYWREFCCRNTKYILLLIWKFDLITNDVKFNLFNRCKHIFLHFPRPPPPLLLSHYTTFFNQNCGFGLKKQNRTEIQISNFCITRSTVELLILNFKF